MSKTLKEFGEAFHDAMFEHDAHEQPTNPLPPTDVVEPILVYPPGVTEAPVYEHLCQVTDPSKYPTLQKFSDMNRKLERAIPDRLQRMRAAIDTSDVTVAILIANVVAMKEALKTDIEASYQKIEEGTRTAATEVERLSKLLADAKSSLARREGAKAALTAANARRFSELDQMEKEFNSLR